MNLIELIITILALSWTANLIAYAFYPLQLLKEKLGLISTPEKLSRVPEVLTIFFNCSKCIAFYSIFYYLTFNTLIYSIFLALLTSLIAAIIEKIIY